MANDPGMEPLRFAIVGAGRGRFAAQVARALPAPMQIVAVCDLRIERARRLAQECGAAFVTDDFGKVLERDEVDALVIATPDHAHAAQSIQALRAGKHVLSEIPMACTLEEIARIVDLGERHDRRYLLGNEVRWFPALEALKKKGDAGCWGKIFYGEAEYLHNLRAEGWKQREEDGTMHWRFDPARPQTTLLGGGPHAFDTLRWLAGERRFVEVFAYGVGAYVEGHPEPGTAVALLKGESGAAYKVTVSYDMARPYGLYFSLYGSEGSFEGGRYDQEKVYYQSRAQGDPLHAWHLLDSPYWNHPGVDLSGGHGTSERFMLEEFLAAVREGRPTAIDVREAARSIAPAVCAFESIRTGKPVAVPAY